MLGPRGPQRAAHALSLLDLVARDGGLRKPERPAGIMAAGPINSPWTLEQETDLCRRDSPGHEAGVACAPIMGSGVCRQRSWRRLLPHV